MKFNKKYGILFWITGLSGSGKTIIAKKIKKEISVPFNFSNQGSEIILNN